MKLAIETICLKEERLIPKFIQHYQDKVDEIIVLSSTKPWQGEITEPDLTANIAQSLGATVIAYPWENETEQRNAGVDYAMDYDWLIVVDPDEIIENKDWVRMYECLETAEAPAYVTAHQRVFWKDKEVFPHTDYQQLIALKPKEVRFIDKRVVNSTYGELPIDLLHFSWSRTNEEVWNKITHYSHADEFDDEKWFREVWLANKQTNLHPKTPETLKALIPAILPPEVEALELLIKPE